MLFTKQNLFPVTLLQVDVVCRVPEDVPYAVKQFGDVLGPVPPIGPKLPKIPPLLKD